ncbi:MAG: PPOX class F420-dependent oxidoreductase [Rhodococcus sp. (in: high G+C Gram-positive bacteria)]
MSDDAEPRSLFTGNAVCALVTLKRDGRPQLSNIAALFSRDSTTARISLTDGRAKTANIRRDPRVSLYVSKNEGWAYAVADGVAELSPVAAHPDDATVDSLVELYRDLQGEHPDWNEFRAAMVEERRLLLTVQLEHFYGMVGR